MTIDRLEDALAEIDRLKTELAAANSDGITVSRALFSADALIAALMTELLHAARKGDAPLPMNLIAAMNSFDFAMRALIAKVPGTPQDLKS